MIAESEFADHQLGKGVVLAKDRPNFIGNRIFSYTTQARAPLFEGAPFELRGRPTPNGCELWAVTPEGTIAMSAQVEFA